MRANGYIVDATHRDYGTVHITGHPVVYEGTPNRPPTAHGPYVGEHNDQVLLDNLSFSPEEATALKASGVIPVPTGPVIQEPIRKMWHDAATSSEVEVIRPGASRAQSKL